MSIQSEFHANKIDISRTSAHGAIDDDFKLVTAWSDEQRRAQNSHDYHQSVKTDDAVLAGGRRNNFSAKGGSALDAFEKRRRDDAYFQIILDQIDALNARLADIEVRIKEITQAMTEIEDEIRDNERAIEALQSAINYRRQNGSFDLSEDGERLADPVAEAALRAYEQRSKKRIDRENPENLALIQQILEDAIAARRDENAQLQQRYDDYEIKFQKLDNERQNVRQALKDKLAERDATQAVETDIAEVKSDMVSDTGLNESFSDDLGELADLFANAPDDTALAFNQKASDDDAPTPVQNPDHKIEPTPADEPALQSKV